MRGSGAPIRCSQLAAAIHAAQPRSPTWEGHGTRVIADNWSLQAVSELLTRGLDADDNAGIAPLTDPDKATPALPQAAIVLESLFEFLTDVVLRDQILVDDQFHDAWFGQGEPLAELARRSIVRPHPFLERPERLETPRREFLLRLLLNPKMAQEQSANEASWAASRTTPHKFTSQLVWGGAGMLARAWVTETPYTPHPLRRRLFERAGILMPGTTALDELTQSVARHRADLYRTGSSTDALFGLHVVLPALPALVLREASSLTDMFVIASQMRGELAELRNWLSQLQEALNQGEFKAISASRKQLRRLAKQVERTLGQKTADAASLNLGWSWAKLTVNFDPTAWMPKFDRVQVQAAQLTFAPSGAKELRELLGFFGHKHSAAGLRTLEHFSSPRP